MASILDRYGIKEVQDVTFYQIDGNGKPTYPVLYLDTLKISTIESTAETADATGGKGNAKLITWDYGKEINVTIEDALFSAKSLAIMFGDGAVRDMEVSGQTGSLSDKYLIGRTEIITAEANVTSISQAGGSIPGYKTTIDVNGINYYKRNPKFYAQDATDNDTALTSLSSGEKYFVTYDLQVDKGSVIEVSADSFPGTYYVTGDTYARNAASGKDEFFQFIIPKAKVTSENTITLEAEGDPSVFNMNLTVLRPDDGIIMKLVKYNLSAEGKDPTESGTTTSEIYHNHDLKGANEA